MKLKVLKKLMIICMSFSLSLSMLPASVLAAQTKATEVHTEISSETTAETQKNEPSTEVKKKELKKVPETEDTAGFVPETTAPVVVETEAVQTPQSESENQLVAEKKTKAAGKVTLTGAPGTDYVNENGKYTIKSDLTMTLSQGASVSEVVVEAGKTLTIVLKGTSAHTIGKISGAGKVSFAKSSNGKVNISGSIDAAEVAVEGGTLLGSGTINSPVVYLNGGSIACKVAAASSVMTGSIALKRIEFQVDKNAVCQITDVQLNGVDVNAETNTIWSDANGNAVLYLAPASTVAFAVKAVTFEQTDDKTSLTAKEQNYTYEDGNLKKGKNSTAYTVKVGAELKTTYGEKLENVDIIAVNASKGYTAEAAIENYDEVLDNSLELKDPTAKGYKVTKKDVKETPAEKSFSLDEVVVTDSFGYEHTLSGTVKYTVEKKELIPIITVNKTSTTSKNKATKVYDGTTDVPDDTCTLSGFSGVVDGDKASEILKVAKASFKYNHADVAKAKNITAEVALSGDWAKFYTVNSVDDISAEITKAELTEEKMKELGITLVKPEITERHYEYLEYKTVVGQEYAYSEKAKDEEWTLAKKEETITYLDEVDGEEEDLKPATTYKIYARIPESDNYLASAPVETKVKTLREPNEAKESDVKLEGVTADSTQKLDTTLNFTATGSTYVDEKDYKPSLDDEKYVPYSWKLTDTTTWKKQKSTQKFTLKPTKAGTYTIVATFRKYVYDGENWVRDEDGDVKKSLTFKANATGTSTSTSSTGTTSASKSGTTTAAKTGDQTPIVPVAAAFAVSGAALVWILKKRKRA